jgi:uncharacterized protein YdhG (YjbR/CyaY superfamily)
MATMPAFDSVDDYIASFSEPVQARLQEVRRLVHAALPGADEAMSYRMPSLRVNGRYVVYLAGWKHHVSIYPAPSGDDELQAAMAPYQDGKGTLRFRHAAPLPADLVTRVATALLAERANPPKGQQPNRRLRT